MDGLSLAGRGLFLTDEGKKSIAAAFNEVHFRAPALRKKIRAPLFDPHASFDEFYKALYLINLSEDRYAADKNITPDLPGPLQAVLELDVLSGITIAPSGRKTRFDHSLLDEFVVADLMNFRNAVMTGAMSYPVRLVRMELDPIFMKFNIYASSGADASGDKLPGFSEEHLKTSEYWQRMFKLYQVRDFQIRAAEPV